MKTTDTTTSSDPIAAYLDLVERAKGGDTTVTADQLAAAKAAAELAGLHAEAARRQADLAAAEQLDADRTAWRANDLAAVEQTIDRARVEYAHAVASLRRLASALATARATRERARTTGRALGLAGEVDEIRPTAGMIGARHDADVLDAAVAEGLGQPKYVDGTGWNRRLRPMWWHLADHDAVVDQLLTTERS
jgi:hypothetical protein